MNLNNNTSSKISNLRSIRTFPRNRKLPQITISLFDGIYLSLRNFFINIDKSMRSDFLFFKSLKLKTSTKSPLKSLFINFEVIIFSSLFLSCLKIIRKHKNIRILMKYYLVLWVLLNKINRSQLQDSIFFYLKTSIGNLPKITNSFLIHKQSLNIILPLMNQSNLLDNLNNHINTCMSYHLSFWSSQLNLIPMSLL